MQGKVEICGINTARLKVLKSEETRELLVKSRNGDSAAREALIYGNLRLVLSVIQRFGNRGENPDDLFQVGCIGLIKAIDHFDVEQGVQFSTYGVPMIIGEVRRFLRDNNSVRVSRSLRDTAYKAIQCKERLTAEKNREPSIEEIAQALSMRREDVVLALEAIVEPVSLYEPVFDHGGDAIYLMDQVGDHSGDGDWLEEIAVKQAIQNLSQREKRILSLRFLEGKTQMEVASPGLPAGKRRPEQNQKRAPLTEARLPPRQRARDGSLFLKMFRPFRPRGAQQPSCHRPDRPPRAW